MEPVLIQANIVLVAPDHRPDIVSKEWLNQQGILNEAPINFVHHQNFSLIETTNFSINVVQPQLTIAARNLDDEILRRLQGVTRRYIRKLPNVSYNAIGLNSVWNVSQMDPNFLKSRFVVDKTLFHETFGGEENYKIGAIIYYEYDDVFRGQLTIAPQNEQIHANFNYHCDLTALDQLINASERFVEMVGHARNIARKFLGG